MSCLARILHLTSTAARTLCSFHCFLHLVQVASTPGLLITLFVETADFCLVTYSSCLLNFQLQAHFFFRNISLVL